MRYQFIENHRIEFRVSLMCRVRAVSPSGYYAWRKRPPSRRKMANQLLLEAIRAAHEASHGIYGSTSIHQEVRDQVACSEKRVARLMKEGGLRAKQAQRYKRTTKANPAHPAAPNLLAGDFAATQANRTSLGYLSPEAFGRRIINSDQPILCVRKIGRMAV